MLGKVKPELKMSYDFAMSSFSRMFGVNRVMSSHEIHRFCVLWAESELPPPEGSLTKVDLYLIDLWKKSTLTT